MDLSKFTTQYIKEAPSNDLRQERKALIRHQKECERVELLMRERLSDEVEEEAALKRLDQLNPRQRAAMERALNKRKET